MPSVGTESPMSRTSKPENSEGIQAASPPRGWGREIAVAALAALSLPNAYVVMEPGGILVDGQAAGQSERRRLSAALQAVAGDKVVLNLRIRIPARVRHRLDELAQHGEGHGIAFLGPVDRQLADSVANIVENEVCHRVPPLAFCA